MSLEKLEKKVENKNNNTVEISTEKGDYLKLNSQVDAVYRLVNNTTRRIERSLSDIKNKQNLIIKLLENQGLDLEELQKQEEIKLLEEKLKALRGV